MHEASIGDAADETVPHGDGRGGAVAALGALGKPRTQDEIRALTHACDTSVIARALRGSSDEDGLRVWTQAAAAGYLSSLQRLAAERRRQERRGQGAGWRRAGAG